MIIVDYEVGLFGRWQQHLSLYYVLHALGVLHPRAIQAGHDIFAIIIGHAGSS